MDVTVILRQPATDPADRRRRDHGFRAPPTAGIPGALVAFAVLAGLDAAVVVAVWPTLARPLWYDEAWRAYHISAYHIGVGTGSFDTLRTANAPLSLGWLAVEKLAVAVGGNTEKILRVPQIISLIALSLVTYTLGRWWLSRPAATIVAGLLTINGGLLVYGMQVKSYLPEATCAVAAVYLWLHARRAADSGGSPWRAQLGMAGCVVMTVTSLFVLVPLLLVDVVDAGRALRAHRLRPARVVGSALVGVVGSLHLALFVLPQSYLTTNPYWRNFFITRDNAVAQLRSAGWELPRDAFTAAMTRPDGQFGSPFTGSPLLTDPDHRLHVCVVAGALLCWTIGVYAAARDRAGRALLVTLGGALLLIAVAAARGQWPIGFVRANLFILPLLYVIAGIGASALISLAWSRIRQAGRPRRWWRPVVVIPAATVLLATAMTATLAVTAVSAQRIRQIRASADSPLLLGDMRELVATGERTARPGDVQIVIPGRWDERQWYKAQQYYVSYYDGYPAPTAPTTPVTEMNTLVLPPLGWAASIPPFLAARPDAGALYLVTYNLVFPDSLRTLDSTLAGLGWCPDSSGRRSWPLTGQITRFVRCPLSTAGPAA
ncbi:hypothetical protein [Frankia sp. CIT1]|uniref:hypothetical protein n=1 Tax=Frankia sp. CIT1 TaxID=2880974 RepID=UPI001EF4987C|nr:hypothetical protein [Frankia sp. CIT1]